MYRWEKMKIVYTWEYVGDIPVWGEIYLPPGYTRGGHGDPHHVVIDRAEFTRKSALQHDRVPRTEGPCQETEEDPISQGEIKRCSCCIRMSPATELASDKVLIGGIDRMENLPFGDMTTSISE